jgi:RsiW-degrading membrane proteinase PrsW (M82 family)
MYTTATFAAALVPSLLLLWYFRSRDVYPEPTRVLLATFGLGILIAVPVLAVAMPVSQRVDALTDPYAYGVLSAFLTAAIPEELFKLAVLRYYCARHVAFDEPMDGIVYGAVASLGFATLENVLYVSDGGAQVAVLRAFTAVPGHAFMGAIMGAYVGRALFAGRGAAGLWALAFIVPTVLHGLYDAPLLVLKGYERIAGAPDNVEAIALAGATLAVLVVEGVWAVRLARAGRSVQLGALVPVRPPLGTLVWAWTRIAVGGSGATLGGVVVLGALVAAGQGEFDPGEQALAVALLGVLPLWIGGLLFRRGVRALNGPAPEANLRAAAPAGP